MSIKRPKRLKFKLQLIISIVLFIQIVIISTLSLFLFHQHISKNAETELTRDLEQTRSSIESLKETLFNRMFLLRYSIEDMPAEDLDISHLHNKVRTHFNTIQTDQAILLKEDGTTIFHMENRKESYFPIVSKIRLENFDFISSRYVLVSHKAPSLFMVTGTKVYHPSGERYYLLFINSIDKDFATNLYKNTGINFVLFVKNTPVCSVVPHFSLPERGQTGFNQVQIGSTPYKTKSSLISSEVPGGVTLTVLRSKLHDNIYLKWLTTIFVLTFFFTLIATLVYIVSVTNKILSPFYELNTWLRNYLKTGEAEELDIKQDGEIEFLAKTIYSMVQKLIREEQIIRGQLHEISFLNKYNTEIMENLRAGVLILNSEKKIDFYNDYLHRILDLPNNTDLTGMNYKEFFSTYFTSENEWDNFPEIHFYEDHSYLLNIRNGDFQNTKLTLKISVLDENDEESRILIVFEDITDTERLWNKILITEKVSSLGLLSAGIAHEINNPLGSIQSHINYLKAVETEDEKKDSINWLETETQRIEEIVQKVLSFSHNNVGYQSYCEIHSIIEEVIELGKFSMDKKDIRIQKRFENEKLNVNISQNEAKQIILNVFLNAAHAIENSGVITIHTKEIDNMVFLYLSDTGHGIDEENLKNIFNPFFSTKAERSSTGLGLSLVYNMVHRSGGDIHVHSAKNKGTTVEISIPLYVEKEEENEYSYN